MADAAVDIDVGCTTVDVGGTDVGVAVAGITVGTAVGADVAPPQAVNVTKSSPTRTTQVSPPNRNTFICWYVLTFA